MAGSFYGSKYSHGQTSSHSLSKSSDGQTAQSIMAQSQSLMAWFWLWMNKEKSSKVFMTLQEKFLREITSAREYGGYLYLGSLHNDRIGKYKLPNKANSAAAKGHADD